MLLEAGEYRGTALDGPPQSPRRTGHKSVRPRWEPPDPRAQSQSEHQGPPLVPIHLSLAQGPHRCLATAAAGNKGRLSRKGEGKGSRPQTRSGRPAFPSAAAAAPPRGGGATWGEDRD